MEAAAAVLPAAAMVSAKNLDDVSNMWCLRRYEFPAATPFDSPKMSVWSTSAHGRITPFCCASASGRSELLVIYDYAFNKSDAVVVHGENIIKCSLICLSFILF